MANPVQAFTKVAAKSPLLAKAGIDPASILAIIAAIKAMIDGCKKKDPETKLERLVSSAHFRMVAGKQVKCPPRLRPAFTDNGCKRYDEGFRVFVDIAANNPSTWQSVDD